jgi:hypothetical protein
MGAITEADYAQMSGVSRGGREVSEEVLLVRDLAVGDGWHFDVKWTPEDFDDASALQAKLTTDAKNLGYKVKTKRTILNGEPNGVVVLRLEPDSDEDYEDDE